MRSDRGVQRGPTEVCEHCGRDLVAGAPVEPAEYRAPNPRGTAVMRAAQYLPPHEQAGRSGPEEGNGAMPRTANELTLTDWDVAPRQSVHKTAAVRVRLVRHTSDPTPVPAVTVPAVTVPAVTVPVRSMADVLPTRGGEAAMAEEDLRGRSAGVAQ